MPQPIGVLYILWARQLHPPTRDGNGKLMDFYMAFSHQYFQHCHRQRPDEPTPCLWLLVLLPAPGTRLQTRTTVAHIFRNLFLKENKQTTVLFLPVRKITQQAVAGGALSGQQGRPGGASPMPQLTAHTEG